MNERKKVKPQTMKLRQKKFLLLADSALLNISREIERPKNHKKDHMEFIKEEIEKMKVSLSTMIFQPTYPLHIVDHWHPKDGMGDMLLSLYYEYLDLE